MKWLTLLAIICLPEISLGQQEYGPDIVWQKCIDLYKEGRLDSTTISVLSLDTPWERFDSIQQFYIHTDTIVYKDGFYSVGQSILDPFMEYNSLPVGEWSCFYPTGKLYSKGSYSLGAYWICNGGPSTVGYSFKNGLWVYWEECGNILATGTYHPFRSILKNGWGTEVYHSEITIDWNCLKSEGSSNRTHKEIVQKINAGH
jgi:hypothetical protein